MKREIVTIQKTLPNSFKKLCICRISEFLQNKKYENLTFDFTKTFSQLQFSEIKIWRQKLIISSIVFNQNRVHKKDTENVSIFKYYKYYGKVSVLWYFQKPADTLAASSLQSRDRLWLDTKLLQLLTEKSLKLTAIESRPSQRNIQSLPCGWQ